MVTVLHHRGPDETGIYLDQNIGLGHSRLSIIGLADGTQPIANEDETLWIVFNGEIFNYIELREELIKKGHQFRTNTDTEVILHLFEEVVGLAVIVQRASERRAKTREMGSMPMASSILSPSTFHQRSAASSRAWRPYWANGSSFFAE